MRQTDFIQIGEQKGYIQILNERTTIHYIVPDKSQRWQIETAFRDAKQHFGFDSYQVKSRKSINGKVQLSFVAASVTK